MIFFLCRPEFFVIFAVLTAFSSFISEAFLSSRIPSKEGWRITPSLVNSRYETSQTSLGLSQTTSAFGGLGRNLEGLFTSGTSSKGGFFVIRGLKDLISCSCSFWVNPVPIFPV